MSTSVLLLIFSQETKNPFLINLCLFKIIPSYWSPIHTLPYLKKLSGSLVYVSILFLEKKGIDDPVGAISAHGVVGIYGVLVVSLTGGADFLGQLTGVAMIAAFTYIASLGVIYAINYVMPIRATDEEQDAGLDISEVGIEAYPEFD